MEQTLLLAPLAGALISAFGQRVVGAVAAQWTALACLLVAWLVSIVFAAGAGPDPRLVFFDNWITSGSFAGTLSFRLDAVSAPLLPLITGMAALCLFFSVWLHRGTTEPARTGSGICLMVFAVVLLAVADDLAQFLAGWMAAGCATYLLTGVARRRPSAGAAARHVAIVMRVGDAALLLAIGALFSVGDTLRFDDLFPAGVDLTGLSVSMLERPWPVTEVVALCCVLAAAVMAAQFIFVSWITTAMEAPPPGAAMIVAVGPLLAALVLLLRMAPVLAAAPVASGLLVLVGLVTAVVAASGALAQRGVLRALACLGAAQAGLALAATGAGAGDVALWMMIASSGALGVLMLGAGLIGAFAHQHRTGEIRIDMLRGLTRRTPMTGAAMALAVLSLCGLGVPGGGPGLTGLATREAMSSVLSGSMLTMVATCLAVFLTALALWRIVFSVCVPTPKPPPPATEDDAPPVRGALPAALLLVAALGVALAGPVLDIAPVTDAGGRHSALVWSALAALFGLLAAVLAYVLRPEMPSRLSSALPAVEPMLAALWYLDLTVARLVVKPLHGLSGRVARAADPDAKALPDEGAGAPMLHLAPMIAERAARFQSGFVASHAAGIAVGVLVLLLLVLILQGAS
ncbi:MAG: proton-conducting transporter membrane subunit [Pseudomonadota bacterium]